MNLNFANLDFDLVVIQVAWHPKGAMIIMFSEFYGILMAVVNSFLHLISFLYGRLHLMALTGHLKYFVKQPLVLMVLNDTSFQTHCSRLANIFAVSIRSLI